MSKPVLRGVLSAAAAVFTLNLLLFSYCKYAALPLLGALFLLGLLIGLGDGAAALLRLRRAGVLEKAGLGLMASTAFFYLAGFLRVLNRPVVLSFFAAALAVTILRFFGRPGKRESLESVREFFSRPLSEYAVFLMPLAFAALPPTFYDSLVYHLGIPNLYLQSGGIVATPQLVYANTFIYYELSLIPAVFLGDLVPRLFHFLLGSLFVLAVADEAVRHWGVKGRLNLVLALASLPMSLFLLVTCKNDLVGAVFIFLALTSFRRGDWRLSAAFWGFALGIKYFNLLPLALFVVVAFRPWKKADLKKLALGGVIVVLAVSPLLLKNQRFNGNPFFPFLSGAFPSPYWDGSRTAYLRADVGRMYRSVGQVYRLPNEVSFSERGSGGIVGPLFLVFLPFLLLVPGVPKRELAFALLLLALTPFSTGSLRFAYVAFVVLAIYCVIALEATATRFLKLVFFVLVAVNLLTGFALLERVYASHLLWSGKLSPEEYKAERFPSYPLFAFVNASTPPRARVLLAGEARNYYLKRPFQASSALDYGILKKYLAHAEDAAALLAAVRRDGFAYLAVNFFELQRLQKKYANYSAGEWGKLVRFFRALTPEFQQGPLCLYRTG